MPDAVQIDQEAGVDEDGDVDMMTEESDDLDNLLQRIGEAEPTLENISPEIRFSFSVWLELFYQNRATCLQDEHDAFHDTIFELQRMVLENIARGVPELGMSTAAQHHCDVLSL